MSELTDLLPQPQPLTFAGRDWEINALTFNELARIEERYGSFANLRTDRIVDQRFLVWAILLPCDPSLTEESVGKMLTLKNAEATAAFINQVLVRSGVLSGDDDAGNALAPTAGAELPSDLPTTSAGSSSGRGSRRKTPAK